MIKLKSTTDSQTFTFIPRFYSDLGSADYNIVIKSEDEGSEAYDVSVATFPLLDYYRTHSAVFTLTENATYNLTIKKTSTSQVIYRDKIFVTNQTSTYSINNNEYVYKPESATEDLFKMY